MMQCRHCATPLEHTFLDLGFAPPSNAYLSAAEYLRATALSKGLRLAETAFASGDRDPERLRAIVREALRAAGIEPDYVSYADPVTLRELEGPAARAVLSLAARVGRARLIDNALLGIRLEDLDQLQ